MKPLLTGHVGTNADLLAAALQMYAKDGETIADVTYGRGVFWRNIDERRFTLLKSDISTGVDFRRLPYDGESVNVLVLDPPYMHGGATVKASINDCYHNENGSHESVIRLYAEGILEAARVLKKGTGRILVKTQDETESGKQRLSHVEIITLLEILGYEIVDVFVLIQETIPAMRESYQKTARKNHSYLIVGRLRR